MKKILALTLGVFLLMGLAACGNSPAADGSLAASAPSSARVSEPDRASGQGGPAPVESTPEETASSNSNGEEPGSPASSDAAQEERQSSEPDTEEQPGETEGAAASLVAYFSWSGNTRTVAEKIQAQTGADLFEIATVNGYSNDYNTVLDEAQAEQSDNARPELKNHIENMAEYQVIYLGYPNWWGDMPMALYSFLDEYDLSGKTIVPFVTSGGSGFSGTIQSIQSAQPDAAVLEGLSISGSSASISDAQIAEWLSGLGLAEP